MSPLVRAAVAAVVVAWFAPVASAAAPVPGDAGKAITFPFPAKAPVVVQVSGHGTARDRLAAMLKTALPDDIDEVTKAADAGIKELLGDRKLSAIPKDGRIFFVVNEIAPLFDSRRTISLLVPVTGYKEFRESFLTADERKSFEEGKGGIDEAKITLFGDELQAYVVDLKEYVAISPDKATAESYAGKYTRATTAAMPAELAKSFVSGDLSLYVNFDVINDLHGQKIGEYKGLIDLIFQQGGGMLPGLNKKQLEAAKIVLNGAFQAVEDARGLVLSVEFRPEGLNLRLQAQFAEDTTTVSVLKAESPGPLGEVGKLPAGLQQYTGSKFGKKFYDAVQGLSPQFAPADDDEKGVEALAKHQKALFAAGPQGDATAAAPPSVSVTVGAYTDAKKAAAALVGCYEAIGPGGSVYSVVQKDAPKLKADAKKHRDFTFTEVKLAFDFDATVRDLPDGLRETTLIQLKETISDKTTAWVGTDGKSVVHALATDWTAVTAALDGYLDGKKSLGDTAGYKLTRKNLPPDASYLILMETGQTLTSLVGMLRGMEGAIPGFPKIGAIKPLKGEPSFVGVAITFKGDTASANVFVPAAAVGTARKMLDGLIKKVE